MIHLTWLDPKKIPSPKPEATAHPLSELATEEDLRTEAFMLTKHHHDLLLEKERVKHTYVIRPLRATLLERLNHRR